MYELWKEKGDSSRKSKKEKTTLEEMLIAFVKILNIYKISSNTIN